MSDSIEFRLTLSATLTQSQLAAIAGAALVEFGSDYQYLGVPAPGALPVLVIGGLSLLARRRRERASQAAMAVSISTSSRPG